MIKTSTHLKAGNTQQPDTRKESNFLPSELTLQMIIGYSKALQVLHTKDVPDCHLILN